MDIPCEHQVEDMRAKAWLADLEREKVYSEFLHLYDFETWQPFCYMKNNTELKELKRI